MQKKVLQNSLQIPQKIIKKTLDFRSTFPKNLNFTYKTIQFKNSLTYQNFNTTK